MRKRKTLIGLWDGLNLVPTNPDAPEVGPGLTGWHSVCARVSSPATFAGVGSFIGGGMGSELIGRLAPRLGLAEPEMLRRGPRPSQATGGAGVKRSAGAGRGLEPTSKETSRRRTSPGELPLIPLMPTAVEITAANLIPWRRAPLSVKGENCVDLKPGNMPEPPDLRWSAA
ncbi:hypothetical protein P7K49_036188 [Saguinus oedipus]|uniref:Uncharacterized protein n=1 Tax=Saguinus oedipus TaxID=9490 RepID=A0ABQ9TJG2_SAGOE|nr:hypothetical protein P7K49_036188 [Saguinus oedipus]